MLVPIGAPNMVEAVRWSAETFHALKSLLNEAGHVTSVGDEGGYAPNITTPEEALDLLIAAIQKAGYRPGADIGVSMDPATSELYHHGQYEFRKSGLPTLTTAEMIALMEHLVDRYAPVFIEDGLAENDWDGWRELTRKLGSRTLLVGDDIFVTNPAIIREGVARGVANATLIKLNQIGHGDRNARGGADVQRGRIPHGDFPSFRRNRGRPSILRRSRFVRDGMHPLPRPT